MERALTGVGFKSLLNILLRIGETKPDLVDAAGEWGPVERAERVE